MPIEIFLALRFMREGRAQTALILGGVAVGVAVIVFLSAIIDGLQKSVIDRTLGTQAHVVISPPDEEARPVLARGGAQPLRIARIEKPAQRVRSIAEWQRVVRRVGSEPGVQATAALVSGPAFAKRGQSTRSIRLLAADPEDLNRIIGVRDFIRAGARDPSATGVLLGSALAKQLGVGPKDRVRIESARGTTQLFEVSGVFELGSKIADEQWAIAPMRAGQTLLGVPGGATEIYVRVASLYEAQAIASRVVGTTGLRAESWMETNAQLLTALRSQSSSSLLIQVFVILAVAMGIASVLIVSVVQRSRAIGILRAVGVPRRRVVRLFLLQGVLYGALGSLLGSLLGAGLLWAFLRFADPLFAVELSLQQVATACAIACVTGVLSAVLPAQRAAKLDPAVAIRNV
jgi:lipoprotein-releasing system permease protein